MSLSHRGLRADRRLRDGRAGRARRLDRLAVLAALRFRRLLRRAARHATSTAAGGSRRATAEARVTRRYRPNTLILETRFESGEGAVTLDRLHAAARQCIRTWSGSWSASAAASRCARELVLRFDYGAIVPWVTRLDDGTLRGDRRPRHGGAAHAGATSRGQNMQDGRRVHGRGRRDGAVRPHLRALAPAAAAAARSPIGARGDRRVLDRVGRRSAGPTGHWSDAVLRSLITLKALHLRADRRHRRGADHLAAGAARRRAQLGLSLLLAARRHAHAARADERRATTTRRRPGASGCCARWPAARTRCRSCTASPASGA